MLMKKPAKRKIKGIKNGMLKMPLFQILLDVNATEANILLKKRKGLHKKGNKKIK